MKPDIVTNQILTLVRVHCTPKVVSDLMSDLRRTEALERRMVGRKHSRQGADISLDDNDKLDRLITLCHTRLSSDEICQVLVGIGDIFKVHGDTGKAEEMYTLALTRGGQAGKGFIAEAYLRRGEIYSRKGQWKQSTADLGRSRVIFSELKHHDSLGRVENILGTNYAEQGKIKQAVRFFERALTLFERSQQSQLAGTVLMNLGVVCNIIGDYDAALTHYKRAQSCFEGMGEVSRLAETHHNMGMSYLSKHFFKEAIREFNVSHTLSMKVHNASLMGLANLGKANAYFRQGDLPMALKLVSQAIESFTRSSDRLSLADAYKVKGMIHRKMDRFDSAESYLQTSLRINQELNNQLNVAETWFEIGMLETSRRKKSDAIAAFSRASACFKKVGAREDEKRTQNIIHSIEGGKQ